MAGKNNRGSAILVLLMAVAIVLVAAVYYLGALGGNSSSGIPTAKVKPAQKKSAEVTILHNLGQIGIGLKMYEIENGAYPQPVKGEDYGLSVAKALYGNGSGFVPAKSIFICLPSDDGGEFRCDYIFHPKCNSKWDKNRVLACSPAGALPSGGVVLYADSRVETVALGAEDYAAWQKAFAAGKANSEFGPEIWTGKR